MKQWHENILCRDDTTVHFHFCLHKPSNSGWHKSILSHFCRREAQQVYYWAEVKMSDISAVRPLPPWGESVFHSYLSYKENWAPCGYKTVTPIFASCQLKASLSFLRSQCLAYSPCLSCLFFHRSWLFWLPPLFGRAPVKDSSGKHGCLGVSCSVNLTCFAM